MFQEVSSPLSQLLIYARRFSIERRLYYIDTRMILLGMLKVATIPGISEQEAEKIITRLENENWEQLENARLVSDKEDVPLTLDAEIVIHLAGKYRRQLLNKQLMPEDLILAILSIDSQVTQLLKQHGIIAEIVATDVWAQKELRKPIKILHPIPKSSRPFPYNPILIKIYTKAHREKLVNNHLREIEFAFSFRDYARCRKMCKQALQLIPDHTDILLILAYTYIVELRFKEAIAPLKKLLAIAPEHNDAMGRLASCYHETGNLQASEALSLRAIELYPDYVWHYNNLGYMYNTSGRYEEAVTVLDKAIALAPEEAFPYNNKAYSILQLGDAAKASALVKHSLELDKGNSYAYYHLALISLREGDKENAIAMLQTAQRFQFKRIYGNKVDDLLDTLKAG